MVAENASQGSYAFLPCHLGILMLGAEEKKESNATFKKETRESCLKVIKYFHEIAEYIGVQRYTLTISTPAHTGR